MSKVESLGSADKVKVSPAETEISNDLTHELALKAQLDEKNVQEIEENTEEQTKLLREELHNLHIKVEGEESEDQAAKEKFLEFKTNLKSLSEKFANPEELKMAKFSLAMFEDLRDLSDQLLASKISSSAREGIQKIVRALGVAEEGLIEEGKKVMPVLNLAQAENIYGSYITDKIKQNYCEANEIGKMKQLFQGGRLKDEALRSYIKGLSDSRVDDLGEPLDETEIDKIMAGKQIAESRIGSGAI